MLTVALVQRCALEVPKESPLAAGYLKAVLDADPQVGPDVEVTIFDFGGIESPVAMCRAILARGAPDVLAFSVLGWNYRAFGSVVETYKQIRPAGLVVYGGNHVANQADRVLREYPSVDVVVNGEGEYTLLDLVREELERGAGRELGAVQGISYRQPDGTVVTNKDRERISDLDVIPSPFLTGAVEMRNAAGRFPYDVALMETNRGCPYKCSFCYWGGAVGQRMRSFSPERLEAELDVFGYHEVPIVVLCDSNFGILEADEKFVELLIKTKERYGFPRSFETSWGKNKSQRFYRIVRELKRHGLQSAFTLALQTLTPEALADMKRQNMKLNDWKDLVAWLHDEGLHPYAELIWGAPGDTPETFLAGYDDLAAHVSRIAVYPMMLLPNTTYDEQRELHGFVTVRGKEDDFEYVLANRTSTVEQNFQMQRFIYWARLLNENTYFRFIWSVARQVAGMTQSEIILSALRWFDTTDDPNASAFAKAIPVVTDPAAIHRGIRRLHTEPELENAFRSWWHDCVVPRFPADWTQFALDVYDYEVWSRALYAPPDQALSSDWSLSTGHGERAPAFVSRPVTFGTEVAEILETWGPGPHPAPRSVASTYTFEAPKGFHHHMNHHKLARQYLARAHRVEPTG